MKETIAEYEQRRKDIKQRTATAVKKVQQTRREQKEQSSRYQ